MIRCATGARPSLGADFGSSTAAILKGLYRRCFELNLGVVEPGRVYRSGQPGRKLSRLLVAYDLRAVLDLEEGPGQEGWCAAEIRAQAGRRFQYFRLPISALRRPLREELMALMTLFDICWYPLLIHCSSGSDRTSLASGLYLTGVQGVDPDRAIRLGFAPEYGHIPLFGTAHLHEPFLEYGHWLREHRLPHTTGRFRTWIEQEYSSRASRPATNESRNQASDLNESRVRVRTQIDEVRH